ncbi:MAG TPA: TlpA disulfide reductase family protein [Chitinophagaceae bacterium]|jgi:thiol-disulfide isomerase/thioredoxin|nr:TlpA disulfide reductase family protein [Chitinophagaceae bacterium]
MKICKTIILLLYMLVAFQSKAQKQVEVVKFDWYKNLRSIENDTTYIINFWATWCLPCVEELPEFEKLTSAYQNEKVKVILVSLDFYKKLSITVIPYLEKTKIKSEVVLLNEPNYNDWIDKVDKSWEGAIPATVIFNNQKKIYHFIEGQTSFAEITEIIKTKN